MPTYVPRSMHSESKKLKEYAQDYNYHRKKNPAMARLRREEGKFYLVNGYQYQ